MGKKAKAKAKQGAYGVRRKAAIMTYPEPAALSGWRWIVDDRMRDYGETDYNRRIIRINRLMHSRSRHRRSVLRRTPARSESERVR